MTDALVAGAGEILPVEIFSPTGLNLPDDLEFPVWERLGRNLQQIAKADRWWVGDWLNHGIEHFGEEHAQAIGFDGVDYKTLQNWRWVAGRIRPDMRLEDLSWSHHRIAAELDTDADIVEVLKRADHEGMTTRELESLVKTYKHTPELEPAPAAPAKSTMTFTLSFTLYVEDEDQGRRVLDHLSETMEAELADRGVEATKTSRSPS